MCDCNISVLGSHNAVQLLIKGCDRTSDRFNPVSTTLPHNILHKLVMLPGPIDAMGPVADI